MNEPKVVATLTNQYPGKDIIKNDEHNPINLLEEKGISPKQLYCITYTMGCEGRVRR